MLDKSPNVMSAALFAVAYDIQPGAFLCRQPQRDRIVLALG